MVHETATQKQAEWLNSLIEDATPSATPPERELLERAKSLITPLLPIYAGYQDGYYYIRINSNMRISTILDLQRLGYRLRYLGAAFTKPIMIKRRD
jgi:hypothetical protein